MNNHCFKTNILIYKHIKDSAQLSQEKHLKISSRNVYKSTSKKHWLLTRGEGGRKSGGGFLNEVGY